MPVSRPVVAAAAVLAAAMVAGCDSGAASGEEPTTRSQRQTYQQQITAIRADVDAGAIRAEARPGSDSRVTVERTAKWTGPKPRIEQRVEDDTLVIEVSCADDPDTDWRCEVSYDLRVPADTAIRAKTGAGEVRADGIAGRLRLRSSAGDVTGRALRGDRVRARSQAGSVDLAFAGPPQRVRARSSTGGVTVRVPRGQAYRVVTQTEVGSTDVGVRTDTDASRVIRARTEVGSITVAYAD